MRTWIVAGSALFLVNCVHLKPKEPRFKGVGASLPAATCASYDGKVVGLTLTALVAGSLGSGAGGLAPAIDDKGAQIGLGGAVVLLAGLAAVASYLSTHYAKRYADGCTDNTGGR